MKEEIIPNSLDDDTPTQPVTKPQDGWQMPEPVFRQSSGCTLPQRLGIRTSEASTELNGTAAVSSSASEENQARTPDKKTDTTGLSMILIGLGAAAVLAVIVLAIIYFLYSSRTNGSDF